MNPMSLLTLSADSLRHMNPAHGHALPQGTSFERQAALVCVALTVVALLACLL